MLNSVRPALGRLYSYLSRAIFLAVMWAALTTASPTAVTKRFSSSPRFLNETVSSAAQTALSPAQHRDRAAKRAAPARRLPIRVMVASPCGLDMGEGWRPPQPFYRPR